MIHRNHVFSINRYSDYPDETVFWTNYANLTRVRIYSWILNRVPPNQGILYKNHKSHENHNNNNKIASEFLIFNTTDYRKLENNFWNYRSLRLPLHFYHSVFVFNLSPVNSYTYMYTYWLQSWWVNNIIFTSVYRSLS